MLKVKKSWAEKMKKPPLPEVKILEKAFWGMEEGSKMLIPTPTLIATYLENSIAGQPIELAKMRKDLAEANGADFTCPLTSGIFLRIASEFTNEQRESGVAVKKLTPVWRILHEKLPLYKKTWF